MGKGKNELNEERRERWRRRKHMGEGRGGKREVGGAGGKETK